MLVVAVQSLTDAHTHARLQFEGNMPSALLAFAVLGLAASAAAQVCTPFYRVHLPASQYGLG